jgi:hypothetical protein
MGPEPPHWIVYTYREATGGVPECHAYGSFDSTADDAAGQPFDQQAAEQLAASINANTAQSGITAMALPLESAEQPGV